MDHRSKTSKGFSLVEMLVALGIAAVVVLALMYLMNNVGSMQKRIASGVEASSVVAEISNMLMEALPYRIPDAYHLAGVGPNKGIEVSTQSLTVRRLAVKGYEKMQIRTICEPLSSARFAALLRQYAVPPVPQQRVGILLGEGFKDACQQIGYVGCGSGKVPVVSLSIYKDSETAETRSIALPEINQGGPKAIAAGFCAVSLSSYELLVSFQFVVPSNGDLKVRRRDIVYPIGQEDLNSPNRNQNVIFLR